MAEMNGTGVRQALEETRGPARDVRTSALGLSIHARFAASGKCGGHESPGRSMLRTSAAEGAHLDLAPESVNAGVPFLRNLLEGLMSFLFQDFEPGAGDQVRDGTAEFGAAVLVPRAGEDKCRHGDLPKPVGRVVIDHGVEETLHILRFLLVREGEDLIDDPGDRPVVVRACGVDIEIEPFEKCTLSRRRLDQPADELDPRTRMPPMCSAARGCGQAPGDVAPTPGR